MTDPWFTNEPDKTNEHERQLWRQALDARNQEALRVEAYVKEKIKEHEDSKHQSKTRSGGESERDEDHNRIAV